MPFYDVECDKTCGRGEVFRLMSEVEPGAEWECPSCHGPAHRLYDVPHEISDNTFKPGYSHALSDGKEPVYLATKEDLRRHMAEKGLARYDKGMGQDQQRQREAETEQSIRKTVESHKADTMGRLYYAKNTGRSPQR